MSNDWFDELLKDVNVRSKQHKNEEDNNVAKNVKIKIKQLDDNVLIIVDYDFRNGTKTLVLYPRQRLEDFLTQITTKRDIYVLKYVIKTLKPYVDMNNVLKQLMTFDLDDYYKNNVKKRRVMLNNVTANVNNVIKQNNVNNYSEQNDYDEQLLQQLRSLINDLNNVNLNDVHNNDELYNAVNYVIQRFVMFLIDVNNIHDGVINNVINYLKRHVNGNVR